MKWQTHNGIATENGVNGAKTNQNQNQTKQTNKTKQNKQNQNQINRPGQTKPSFFGSYGLCSTNKGTGEFYESADLGESS